MTSTCEVCHGYIGGDPPPTPREFGCRCHQQPPQPAPYGQTFYEYFRDGEIKMGSLLPTWDKLRPEERDLIQSAVVAAIQHYRKTSGD